MNSYILMIVEGEKDEVIAINSLNEHFYNTSNMHILSFKTNIYTLYSQLKEDEFETDILEILKEKNAGKDILSGEISIQQIQREQVSEVYLLFDYDGHHYRQNPNRVKSELQEMITHFDNETEHGKLYLSYPMIEAINFHHTYNQDEIIICHFDANSGRNREGKHFKKISIEQMKKKLTQVGYTKTEWEDIFKHFIQVLHYFCGEAKYSSIDPKFLFEKQLDLITNKNQITVLSGLPPLIFEYFGRKYFNQLLEQTKITIEPKYINLSN